MTSSTVNAFKMYVTKQNKKLPTVGWQPYFSQFTYKNYQLIGQYRSTCVLNFLNIIICQTQSMIFFKHFVVFFNFQYNFSFRCCKDATITIVSISLNRMTLWIIKRTLFTCFSRARGIYRIYIWPSLHMTIVQRSIIVQSDNCSRGMFYVKSYLCSDQKSLVLIHTTIILTTPPVYYDDLCIYVLQSFRFGRNKFRYQLYVHF